MAKFKTYANPAALKALPETRGVPYAQYSAYVRNKPTVYPKFAPYVQKPNAKDAAAAQAAASSISNYSDPFALNSLADVISNPGALRKRYGDWAAPEAEWWEYFVPGWSTEDVDTFMSIYEKEQNAAGTTELIPPTEEQTAKYGILSTHAAVDPHTATAVSFGTFAGSGSKNGNSEQDKYVAAVLQHARDNRIPDGTVINMNYGNKNVFSTNAHFVWLNGAFYQVATVQPGYFAGRVNKGALTASTFKKMFPDVDYK